MFLGRVQGVSHPHHVYISAFASNKGSNSTLCESTVVFLWSVDIVAKQYQHSTSDILPVSCMVYCMLLMKVSNSSNR